MKIKSSILQKQWRNEDTSIYKSKIESIFAEPLFPHMMT